MQADTHKHTHTLFEYPLGKPFKAKLLIFNGIRLTCWGALRKLDLEIVLNGERYIHQTPLSGRGEDTVAVAKTSDS